MTIRSLRGSKRCIFYYNLETLWLNFAGSQLLSEVHRRFYDAYDNRLPGSNKAANKRPNDSKRRGSTLVQHSATVIIPRMRAETLAGVHILFSSVIPLDMRPESSEMWRLAIGFGATCHKELTPEVTHLIAAKVRLDFLKE